MPDEAQTQPEPSRPVNAAERCPDDREAIREAFRKHPPQTCASVWRWWPKSRRSADPGTPSTRRQRARERKRCVGSLKPNRRVRWNGWRSITSCCAGSPITPSIDFAYTNKLRETITIAARDYWDRHIEAAQRRYVRALKMQRPVVCGALYSASSILIIEEYPDTVSAR